MIVGLLEITIHLHGVRSLKEKRSIIKSLVERMRNRFNVSAAETDNNDLKLIATIGVSVVSNDSRFANQMLDKVIDFASGDPRYSIGQIEREVFSGI